MNFKFNLNTSITNITKGKEIVGTRDIRLLLKGKFERMTECDEFDKIRQIFLRVWIQN